MFEGGTLKDENIPATVARAADVPTDGDFDSLSADISNVSESVRVVEENLANHTADENSHFLGDQKSVLMESGLLLTLPSGTEGGTAKVSTLNGTDYTNRLRETLNVPTKDETYSKDELYTKTETYSKEEVYSKEESYSKEELDAKFASIVTDIFHVGTTAPENTKLLWIDTTATTGGLKYYNGTKWVHVPVAYN